MSPVVLVSVLAVVAVVVARGVRVRSTRRVRARLVSRTRSPAVAWSAPLVRWLAPRLAAADVDRPPEEVVRWWLAAAAGVPLLAVVVGPVAAVLAAVALAAGPPVALASTAGRRDDRVERELGGLLEAVARSLRAGSSLPVALGEAAAAPTAAAADLREVLLAVGGGVPLGEALEGWARARPLPGVRLAVGALVLAVAAGGAPAQALDGVAATLRERHEVDREVRALAAQARTSALVVTLAPLAFGGLGLLGDERTAAFLLTTPLGLGCLVGGLALDGLGAWWMARLTATRPATAAVDPGGRR